MSKLPEHPYVPCIQALDWDVPMPGPMSPRLLSIPPVKLLLAYPRTHTAENANPSQHRPDVCAVGHDGCYIHAWKLQAQPVRRVSHRQNQTNPWSRWESSKAPSARYGGTGEILT